MAKSNMKNKHNDAWSQMWGLKIKQSETMLNKNKQTKPMAFEIRQAFQTQLS